MLEEPPHLVTATSSKEIKTRATSSFLLEAHGNFKEPGTNELIQFSHGIQTF